MHPKAFSELNQKIALDLLARDGIEVVWTLHLKAAKAHREGFPRAAELMLRAADAAEEWLRRMGE